MAERWLTIEEARAAAGWSRRWAFQQIASGNVVTKEDERASGNGRKPKLIAASSLPARAQLKLCTHPSLGEPRIRMGHPSANEDGAPQLKADALALRDADNKLTVYSSEPTLRSSRDARLAEGWGTQAQGRLLLRAQDQSEAERRMQAIVPLDDFLKGGRGAAKLLDGTKIGNSDEMAAWLSRQHGVSARTIWRWHSKFKQAGAGALAKKDREDKGVSRFFTRYPKAAEFVQAKYLRERRSMTETCEALQREWPAMYNHGSRAASLTAVRDYLNSLPEPVRILAREGGRAFQERCEPYVLRQPPQRVNQVWISDHVAHDVWTRNFDEATGRAYFSELPLNAALRPWMTAWMDWHSRKAVGAAWSANPSSHSISSALRVAILENGVPEEAYVDNGIDYKKCASGAPAAHPRESDALREARTLSAECRGVLARLNIETTKALPYHAQSKPIESWFGNRLHERFDTLWIPVYCGTSPKQRPEECDEALREHKKFMDGKRAASPLPAAGEFIRTARQFLEEYNRVLPHSGRGMGRRTPEEVFTSQAANLRRLTEGDRDVLNALFWHRDRRRVMEGGCVEIFHQRYEPADAPSAAGMYEELGRDVMIACDPANLGEALGLDMSGNVIARLKSSELLAWGPVSRAAYTASLRERRTLRRGIKQYIANVGRGTETELEALQRRAGLAEAATGDEPTPQPKRLMTGSRLAVATKPKFVDDVISDVRALMDEEG